MVVRTNVMNSSLYHNVTDTEEDETPYEKALQVPPASCCNGALPSTNSWTRRKVYAITLFSSTIILLFADQNLMSPNLTAIAADFGFSNEERDEKLGGEIALAFFLLGAPASFIVGCLGDTFNRSKLFALTVGIGEGGCVATYFSHTYPQLYVCRAVTGFSLGGALPLIYSILGDLFTAQERHTVSALVSIGSGCGISLGQGIAGYLGPTFGWRVPFLVIGIPALLCATLVYFTVPDPERGCMEEAFLQRRDKQLNADPASVEMTPLDKKTATTTSNHTDNQHINDNETASFNLGKHWQEFLSLFSTPTVVFLLLQGAPGCLPWGIINTYLNDFLAQDRGMSVQIATTVILFFGVGGFFGMLMGGAAGSYLYRIDKRYPALLAGSMALIACFPLWIMLNINMSLSTSSQLLVMVPVAILAGLCAGATGPIVRATLQNVTLPQSRGQAFALFNLFDDFGKGLGPVFISGLIRYFGGHRTPAFNIGVLGWMLCGIFNLCAFWTVERDEQHVQQILASRLAPPDGSSGSSHLVV
jgi:predicted MFS family arabinose efflux permease